MKIAGPENVVIVAPLASFATALRISGRPTCAGFGETLTAKWSGTAPCAGAAAPSARPRTRTDRRGVEWNMAARLRLSTHPAHRAPALSMCSSSRQWRRAQQDLDRLGCLVDVGLAAHVAVAAAAARVALSRACGALGRRRAE